MSKWSRGLIALVILLTACSPAGAQNGTATPGQAPTATAGLPTPEVVVTHAPDPSAALSLYLDAWKNNQIDQMYALISSESSASITAEDFNKLYTDTSTALTMKSLDYSVLSTVTNPTTAQLQFSVVFHTNLFGDLSRDMAMNLVMENGGWRVAWDYAVVLPELEGGNHLALNTEFPARGEILDRNGESIAYESDVVALGVIPGEIENGHHADIVSIMATLTGRTWQSIADDLDTAYPSDYVPVGEVSADEMGSYTDVLAALSGVYMHEYTSRYYADGGVAPQVVGYTQSLTEDNIAEYRRMGYPADARIGTSGLEQWGEEILAGKPSASLYVVDPSGNIITRIAQCDSTPSQDIYTTLDMDLQIVAQEAIQGFIGSAVVMERDTGRILAMASSPGFDPNLFDVQNYNNSALVDVLNSTDRPLFNRATSGTYPLGSVFKIITMAAALESGQFTKDTTYDCTSDWSEIPGLTLDDWTKAKELPPSGVLTLQQGLMRSCNPWFYHIGLTVYRAMGPNYLANIALGFGLGAPTGLEQLHEEAGNIQPAASEEDSAQQAIGQGTMLVTPLQVADFVAAVGNGGTLYQPQLVEKISAEDAEPTFTFSPIERGVLPVSAENLQAIQDAMRMVVKEPRGTAHRPLMGMGVTIYGKTGTASKTEEPHAWFAGYTNTGRTDRPDIVVVVIAEEVGDGSAYAAPIFRRIVEAYYGYPLSLYPWESLVNVTRTPTPEGQETPTPEAATTEETPVP